MFHGKYISLFLDIFLRFLSTQEDIILASTYKRNERCLNKINGVCKSPIPFVGNETVEIPRTTVPPPYTDFKRKSFPWRYHFQVFRGLNTYAGWIIPYAKSITDFVISARRGLVRELPNIYLSLCGDLGIVSIRRLIYKRLDFRVVSCWRYDE